MKRSIKLIPLVAATLFAMSSASATPSIAITSFDSESGLLTGTATFPPLGEQSVVLFEDSVTDFQPTGADDLPPEVAQHAGLDLQDALIAPLDNGLRFIWQLSSPIEVIPPEGLRYNWSFTVGGQNYQLQAKVTNMASLTTTEAPEAHVQQLASGKAFFQLRGRCTPAYLGTPVAGCFHLGFLDGNFDMENGRITMDLPYGMGIAPDVVRGVTIVEAQSAGMSISASLQAVVSNATISAYINGWGQYVTVPTVAANRVSAATDPAFATYDDPMTLAEDGTFSGLVDGAGSKVIARACHGARCSIATLTV